MQTRFALRKTATACSLLLTIAAAPANAGIKIGEMIIQKYRTNVWWLHQS